MGELHLEIYVERMKREYNVECTTGRPRVAFRETISQRADFAYTHKKQTGGAGQFARVVGFIEPMERDEETGKDVEFENVVMSGNIPHMYITGCEKVCYPAILLVDASSADCYLIAVRDLGLLRGFGERFTHRQPDHRMPLSTKGRCGPRR
jgi:translation elongation factor EF-G